MVRRSAAAPGGNDCVTIPQRCFLARNRPAGVDGLTIAATHREKTMVHAFKMTVLAGALALIVQSPAVAQGVADFYKGKTINVIVGFGPGGGYDLYARALGRSMGKHIPGNPNVVVQNMDGAGSVRAANHVYAVAPKDGTFIAAVNQNVPMYQLLGGGGAQFEADKLQWLGSMANSNGLIYTWHTSGIKTIEDAKQREVPLGAVGTSSDSYIFPTIINSLLGTKFKPIPGYTGTGQINIAVERGEVMGRGGNTWASIQSGNKNWLDEKKLNLVVQIGFEKEPELPDVPLLMDLVQTEEGKQIVKVISLPTVLGYTHWVAPGVPPERIEALRTAYVATMKDPEFLKEAEKLGMQIRPQTGAQVSALAKQVTDTPKPVLAKTAQILNWKN
jgi:tripartite-type tricarboxylate transporter receptor subunit TctC